MTLSSLKRNKGWVIPTHAPTPGRVYDTLQAGESCFHAIEEDVDWGNGGDNRDEIIHHTGITVGTAVTAIMRMFVIRHLVSESPCDHTSRDEPC